MAFEPPKRPTWTAPKPPEPEQEARTAPKPNWTVPKPSPTWKTPEKPAERLAPIEPRLDVVWFPLPFSMNGSTFHRYGLDFAVAYENNSKGWCCAINRVDVNEGFATETEARIWCENEAIKRGLR